MPQKYNIHSHGHPQITTGLLHSSQGHTVYKIPFPLQYCIPESPLHCWNLLQRSNPTWRGPSPRWSSSSYFLGPLRGQSYVHFPIGELTSACAIRPRRWRPPITIQCDLMITIAISAGPHRPYLGRCDQCRIGHLNSAITQALMEHQRDDSITMRFTQSHDACCKFACAHALPSFLPTCWTIPSRFLFVSLPLQCLLHP